jgi:hypothetical protein
MSSDFQNRMRNSLEQSAPEQHPAPDVLNAYIERVLPAAEERKVLAHLSGCSECREVVYLASSAAEEPATPVAAPARRVRWWTWAVPLMAVLVVASAVLLQQLQQSRSFGPNSSASRQVAQARRDASPTPESAPAAISAPESQVQKKADTARSQVVPPQAAKEKGEVDDKQARAPAQGVREESDRLAISLAKAPREAKAAPAPAVRSEPTKNKNVIAGLAPAPSAPLKAGAPAQSESVDVISETALVDEQSAGNVATRNAPAKDAGLYRYSAANVRTKSAQGPAAWKITPDGKLQHLLLGEWQPALAVPQAQFLTVSSVGGEVWAAGKNLALYHSADNGVHWDRQILPAPATDIVHIEFANAMDGILKTSSAGGFSTHDGGKTWVSVSTP